MFKKKAMLITMLIFVVCQHISGREVKLIKLFQYNWMVRGEWV